VSKEVEFFGLTSTELDYVLHEKRMTIRDVIIVIEDSIKHYDSMNHQLHGMYWIISIKAHNIYRKHCE